jgi:hypothetical protein
LIKLCGASVSQLTGAMKPRAMLQIWSCHSDGSSSPNREFNVSRMMERPPPNRHAPMSASVAASQSRWLNSQKEALPSLLPRWARQADGQD